MSQEHLSRKELRQQEREQKKATQENKQRTESRKKAIVGASLVAAVVLLVAGAWVLQQQELTIENVSKDPSKGSDTAQVVVAEYADFQCPACAAVAPVVNSLMETYGDRVRFEYNDFPLPQHEYAPDAAIAGQCAFEQGKFYELHDILYSRQSAWSAALTHESAQNTIRSYAEEVGVDMTAFDACVTRSDIAATVDEDIAEARKAGVNSTPTFFVNGKRVVDVPFSSSLKKAIDEALAQ